MTYPKAQPVSDTDSTLLFPWPGRTGEKLIDWTVPDDDVRFELTTRKVAGGWSVTTAVRGLAMDKDHTIYGVRTMSDVKENGYFLEGRVSIDGVKRKAFTSDRLFLNAAGKLVKVAVLHVITTQPGEPT